MVQLLTGAGRFAALMLVVGVSSAFGALYTFDLTSATRLTSTPGGGLVITSGEDPGVTVTLTALAGGSPSIVVINSAGSGVSANGSDDIQTTGGGETLIISPLLGGSPFTADVQSVTFSNVDSAVDGDDATVFLDGVSSGDIAIDVSTPTYTWNAPASTTFTSNISFAGVDGNDDFEVSQIVLDITVGEVPEPSTWTLFGLGIAGLAWMRRRKRS